MPVKSQFPEAAAEVTERRTGQAQGGAAQEGGIFRVAREQVHVIALERRGRGESAGEEWLQGPGKDQRPQHPGLRDGAANWLCCRCVKGQSAAGIPLIQRSFRSTGGQRAGVDGVADPLAGDRIDEAGGIARQQDSALAGRGLGRAEGQEMSLDLGILARAELGQIGGEVRFHLGVPGVQAAQADGGAVFLGKGPAIAPVGCGEVDADGGGLGRGLRGAFDFQCETDGVLGKGLPNKALAVGL